MRRCLVVALYYYGSCNKLGRLVHLLWQHIIHISVECSAKFSVVAVARHLFGAITFAIVTHSKLDLRPPSSASMMQNFLLP